MTKLNEVKIPIMQVAYFLNSPMFNLLFYCYIVLFWEKVTSYEKFNSQNCMKNFSVFIAIDKSIKMLNLVEFSKILIKMKNCKTFYKVKQRAILRKLSCHSKPDKILLRLWNKNFVRRYTEIYRHMLSENFKNMQFLGMKH